MLCTIRSRFRLPRQAGGTSAGAAFSRQQPVATPLPRLVAASTCAPNGRATCAQALGCLELASWDGNAVEGRHEEEREGGK
jgi:hypothetical protein